jgi:hypothetical protein
MLVAPAVQPASAAPMAAPQKEVDRLVAVLISEDQMAALATRTFDYEIENGRDAKAKALYARYPGLRDAVAEKLRPQMLKILRRGLPDLRAQIAAILSADLNPAELHQVTEFFTSPTGRKVYAKALQAMGDHPERSEKQVTDAAMAAIMSGLAPSDYGPLMLFGASSAAGKMNTINPKIAAASKAWANALVAANQARIRKLAKRAADRYVAKQDRGKS